MLIFIMFILWYLHAPWWVLVIAFLDLLAARLVE
jgi:hypothetical protein